MPYRVRNWRRFQHYKDRNPPWIKLHTSILVDRDFMALDFCSQGLLVQIWVLASESSDATVSSDLQELSFRLRKSVTEKDIKPLLKKFLSCIDETGNLLAGAITALAVAVPETEGETEGETEKRAATPPARSKRLVFMPPTLEQAKEFFSSKGVNGNEYARFYAYFDGNGWVQGKARAPIKQWRSAAMGWMLRKGEMQ